MRTEPLVSVLTPVYNGEAYLVECIESVLAQTYSNWEYIIVNNCSKDGTLKIAEEYAAKDRRIRVYSNDSLLPIIANHNRAFGLISPESKYCKVVSADDWLFPECLMRMVTVAETNPSVGIVGSYQLSGAGTDGRNWRIKWAQLAYPGTVTSGREICRYQLLNSVYIFGTPTSLLYRADLVRRQKAFYPNATAEGDTSACYKALQETDFGFVHQVLSYERVHEEAISATCRRMNSYDSSWLSDLKEYGHSYLTEAEFESLSRKYLANYYVFLTQSVFDRRDKEFWKYHKKRLVECGNPLSKVRLAKGVCLTLLDLSLNPKHTVERVLRRAKSN